MRNASNLQILAITFLLSLNSFLVEANSMQMLSASLGGTLLQYQFGIGLFIFSLGMGSLLYPHIASHLSNKKILLISNFSIGIISIVSPFFIYSLDQLFNVTFASPFVFLYYLPLLLAGFVTGLDLPTLIFLDNNKHHSRENFVLGMDYLGMFFACLIFPFAFYYFGIFQSVFINILIFFLIFIFLISIGSDKKSSQKMKTDADVDAKIHPIILYSCLLFSICSLCYELLLGRLLVDFLTDEVWAMTLTMGFYLLGLGVGSMAIRKKNLTSQFLVTELVLISSMGLIPLLFSSVGTFFQIFLSIYFSQYVILPIFLFLISWIGFWSGRELPLFLFLQEGDKAKSYSRLFFMNYLGALIGTLGVSLFIIPRFGIFSSILIVVCLNILGLFLLHIYFYKQTKLYLVTAVLITAFVFPLPSLHIQFEQISLKARYHRLKLQQLTWSSVKNFIEVTRNIRDIRRITTPYQYIDLVNTQFPDTGSPDDLTMYLNHQPQFSLEGIDLYHDSFAFAPLNLTSEKPQKVLVLGGGDGFLVDRLVGIDSIQSIYLIELDKEVLSLANKHYRISAANHFSLKSPKVTVLNTDAYSWLKENPEVFDGIFIDFPYPTNYETGRLYSKEFYQLVLSHLSPKGFIALDAPLSLEIENPNLEPSVLINTLRAAGFRSIFPFGVIEPFVYAEKEKRHIEFDYQKLQGNLKNSSFVNFSNLSDINTEKSLQRVNSLYKPKKVATW